MKVLAHRVLEFFAENPPLSTDAQMKDIQYVHRCSEVECREAVALLVHLNVVVERSGSYSVIDEFLIDHTSLDLGRVRSTAWDRLISSIDSQDWQSLFQYDAVLQALVMDVMVLPWSLRVLRDFLLSIGAVFRRSELGRFWKIDHALSDKMLDRIKCDIERSAQSGLTVEQLEEITRRKVSVGKVAEDWILLREQHRLAGHPLIDSVQAVGQRNLSLGYDIRSFSTVSAVVPDRFIEVKSFVGEKTFYFSQGEYDAAKNLRSNYWLVLVDRNRLSEPGYEPLEIRDPYGSLFAVDQDGWDVRREGWFVQERNWTK